MSNRRFTRLTNAHSKKLTNHGHSLALWFTFYNFIWAHKSLGKRTMPAMAAGMAENPYTFDWIVDMIDRRNPPKPRGPYKPRERGRADGSPYQDTKALL